MWARCITGGWFVGAVKDSNGSVSAMSHANAEDRATEKQKHVQCSRQPQ